MWLLAVLPSPGPLPPVPVRSPQAAQHVQLLTAAIAKQPFKDSDAAIYLRAHDKSDSTVGES